MLCLNHGERERLREGVDKDTERHKEHVSDKKKKQIPTAREIREIVRKATRGKVPVTGRMISSFNQAS